MHGSERSISEFLKTDASLIQTNTDGLTPLDLARKHKHIEVVQLLDSAIQFTEKEK